MIRTWHDIPGFFDFQDIYDQAVEEAGDGARFVEIGAFLGKSTAYMAEKIRASKKDIAFLTVDSWNPVQYARWWEDVRANPPAPWPVEELYGKPLQNAFWYCMEQVSNGLQQVLEMSSVDASKMFRDKSLSFVFIDADHLYPAISADIAAWRGKVKPGGILAGHDYRVASWPDVARAVDEQFANVEHRNNSWLVRL